MQILQTQFTWNFSQIIFNQNINHNINTVSDYILINIQYVQQVNYTIATTTHIITYQRSRVTQLMNITSIFTVIQIQLISNQNQTHPVSETQKHAKKQGKYFDFYNFDLVVQIQQLKMQFVILRISYVNNTLLISFCFTLDRTQNIKVIQRGTLSHISFNTSFKMCHQVPYKFSDYFQYATIICNVKRTRQTNFQFKIKLHYYYTLLFPVNF
eukprot:TRINITY_DN4982_c0_g1_i1.p1 TRINITY_DN4982_c0_g1~~TRINITY_DN4982_c0_g1_i1.p1  ORF type:complete len:212 (+),score=-26.69 TRINITY_DN4982_c0_g1_i1:55-690(+)